MNYSSPIASRHRPTIRSSSSQITSSVIRYSRVSRPKSHTCNDNGVRALRDSINRRRSLVSIRATCISSRRRCERCYNGTRRCTVSPTCCVARVQLWPEIRIQRRRGVGYGVKMFGHSQRGPCQEFWDDRVLCGVSVEIKFVKCVKKG